MTTIVFDRVGLRPLKEVWVGQPGFLQFFFLTSTETGFSTPHFFFTTTAAKIVRRCLFSFFRA